MIEWFEDPENGGVKSDCGRFILRDLEPYQFRSGKIVIRCVLVDNSPTWFVSRVFKRRADAISEAEFRRRFFS